MSRPVRDKMLDLDADLDAVRFPPASQIRKRGQHLARRRVVAGATVATAAVALAGAGFVLTVPAREPVAAPVGAAPQASCAAVEVKLPDDPRRVTVRTTGSPAITELFRSRGFTIDDRPADGERTGTTIIRYGPSAVGAAALVEAFVDGPVSKVLVPGRAGAVVDLVPATSLRRLRTPTELNQFLVAAGEPTRPAELCRAGG